MRVQHNIAAMNSYRNFGINNSKMSKNLEKLSSGYAINRAGDDAAGLAVSEKMRWQITSLEAGVKNAKDGIGLVQTAEGALTEVHDMLNRMTYLAEQAANSTYEQDDRDALDEEFQALGKEITRIRDTANFNGKFLIKGAGDLNITVDEQGSQLKVDSYDLTNDVTSVTSGNIKTSGDALTMAKTTLKAAIKSVSTQRAKFGALQNRLEHTINNLNVMKENITDAESRIRDTDVAEEMMKFTKNSIMNQAAQAMLAQSNQLPQGVLQLLQ